MARKSLESVPRLPGNELTFELKEWFNSVFRHYRIIDTITQIINPSSVAANTTVEEAFTVVGVEIEDTVLAVTKPTHSVGLGIVGTRVSATNTVSITFMNNTGAVIQPPPETYKIDILKFRGN